MDAAEISYTPPTAMQESLPEITPVQESSFAEIVKNFTAAAPKSSVPGPEPLPEITPPEKNPVSASDAPVNKMNFSPLVRESRQAAFSGVWPERITGVIDSTYIVAESAAGMVLIDQHAAHERIMFEKILAGAESGSAASQALLIPETVELPLPMVKLLENSKELFAMLGFDTESIGGTAVIINAVPLVPCAHRKIGVWLYDMLSELLENSGSSTMLSPEYAARAACKAAVKAHETLSLAEMENLLSQLRQCRQGTLCPHGRPTMIEIPLKEIERRFGRR